VCVITWTDWRCSTAVEVSARSSDFFRLLSYLLRPNGTVSTAVSFGSALPLPTGNTTQTFLSPSIVNLPIKSIWLSRADFLLFRLSPLHVYTLCVFLRLLLPMLIIRDAPKVAVEVRERSTSNLRDRERVRVADFTGGAKPAKVTLLFLRSQTAGLAQTSPKLVLFKNGERRPYETSTPGTRSRPSSRTTCSGRTRRSSRPRSRT
jgi:hypothetical protein